MRIAIVSPWAISQNAVGGTERFVMDLAESLSRIDHNTVQVYMFSGNGQVLNGVSYQSINLLGDDVPVDEYTLKENLGDFSLPETYRKLAERIESLIKADDFDVIHINTQLLLCAWTSKKRIFTVHTNPFEFRQAWGAESYPIMVELAKAQARNSLTTFTAPSRHYADLFSRLLDSPVLTIPHALATDRLLPSTSNEELCYKYNLTPQMIHILLPSRLEPVQKQPQLFFEALSYLPRSLVENLEIISSGVDPQYEQHQHRFEGMAKDKGYKVRFIRFDAMSEAYALADMVVLPSRSESFGYSALEALSLGIPTVMNRIPTFKEIADGNPQASFFDNNSQDLAEKLKELLSGRLSKSINLPTEWRQRYSIAQWAKAYEELLP